MKDLQTILERAHQGALDLREGDVARYIPELARVDPERFALALCTVEGEVVSIGDDAHELTLQSLSKPFVYGRALERLGVAAVRSRIGVEPSGDAFDSIIQLDGQNRPHNPMINAGAIAVSGLLAEHGESISSLLEALGDYAGRPLTVDAPVYLSERTAGHRNRAIAHLMHHLEMLAAPVDPTLALYFQQCSVLVSCRDLAVMAATLANGGCNPLTGAQAIASPLVHHVLTVMLTCGFYDAAGRSAFDVGLPSKSGVSGGVVAVAPGRLGIAAFSPRLDALGSSVRGAAAVADVAQALELHLLEPRPVSVSSAAASQPAEDTAAEDPEADLTAALHAVHTELRSLDGGEVASYLPPAPQGFALAACTIDGQEIAVGDAEAPFSIQSAANPFAYGLAMDLCGVDAVHRRVGVEPSDNPFNAIHFDPRTDKPFNPLGNAGAIAVCSLIPGDPAERLKRILAGFAALAGEERLVVDAAVLDAEHKAGGRNRAIASLLRNFQLVDDEAAALELYFQQCAIRVNCRLLARLGATLANAGTQPLTRRQALPPELVRHVLSVMLTCGLHDESGRFAFDVGLPAKTGISGGIVAVVPGRMGLAVYSPPVNDHGSSVRGLAALQALSERL
ncbi:MAG: glutaminase A, partial [Acidobacteriota bacterium]